MQQNTKRILELYIEGKDDDQAQILEQIYSEKSRVTFEMIPDTISATVSMGAKATGDPFAE